MKATTPNEQPRKADPILFVGYPQKARASRRSHEPADSLGMLYAHALAIMHEAEVRYRELAAHMADSGNDSVADLFVQRAEFEGRHAFLLARNSLGVEIPRLAPGEHAWLDCGPPSPEARAFVYSMMTPRLALEIALGATEQAKAFFDKVRAGSRNAGVRERAAEFAQYQAGHIAWVKNALACVPEPYQPGKDDPDDAGALFAMALGDVRYEGAARS